MGRLTYNTAQVQNLLDKIDGYPQSFDAKTITAAVNIDGDTIKRTAAGALYVDKYVVGGNGGGGNNGDFDAEGAYESLSDEISKNAGRITEVERDVETLKNPVDGVIEFINTPDKEDLAEVGRVLKFADKEYNESAFSGLGRIYLRKNIAGGKNILTQDVFTSENTIYIIQYDYTLDDGAITIPSGCVLDFQGGSLADGTIYFNDANVRAGSVQIFDNIEFGSNPEGSLNVCWFGANYKEVVDSTDAFNAACSKRMPVYIPNGTFYIGGTVRVYASIKSEGYIRCFGKSSEATKVVFLVESVDFSADSSETIVLDGLHIVEIGEKWTRTAIEVQRTDTVVQNCYVLACDFGIRLRIYCTYITNSCVRTCNTNIDVSALSNYQQTCNVAIIGCVSQHANDLALSIGVHRPDLAGAGDYHSGFGILVSGCAFDEGTVQIEKSHTVGIRDCYFERATARNVGILINQDSQDYSRSRSRNIVIESCTFIEFKYAIKVWLGCEDLAIRNCNFKACRRYAIAMRYESANYPVTIESNVYEDDVERDVFYAYRNWGGIYSEMALRNLSYDNWYMRRGVQVMPHVIEGIPINFNALITNNENRSLLSAPSNSYGNVYAEPLVVDAPATHYDGKLTFHNDADYVKLTLNDRLMVNGRMVLIIDLELDENVATIMDVGGAGLANGEEVTASHVTVELNYFQKLEPSSYRPSDAPVGYCLFDTTLGKPIWKSDSGWVDATGVNV